MIIKGNNKRGKPITILKTFSVRVEEYFTSFLKNLIVNTEANNWNESNLLEVIKGFFKDDARE